ncbi:hypothetical protein G6L37_03805 [Agrobacterium rubi]|nr:hypothetical protein [Agrobacterium rubi]NTF24474.1 hypothetical protein [Agrobacterium rubi]
MPSYLHVDLQQYIEPTSTYASIRNLTKAAESGAIPLSSVASYIRASERGDEIRYSKTRPVPLAMKEMIASRSDLLPRQVVYMGWKEGRWSLDDVEAWENNQTILSEARAPVQRGVYLTRGRRVLRRLPNTEGRFVPKMSLDALCRFGISDGAKACLALLMSIAGKESTIVTYTSSIATELGRTPRTVRNHFIALEEAGLITRTPGREPNTVRITISADCRPEPYQEPEHVKAFKLASRSSNKILQMMAFSVSSAAMGAYPAEFRRMEGRKEISPFNPESILLSVSDAETSSRQATSPGRSGPTTHSTLIRGAPAITDTPLGATGRTVVRNSWKDHSVSLNVCHHRQHPSLSCA